MSTIFWTEKILLHIYTRKQCITITYLPSLKVGMFNTIWWLGTEEAITQITTSIIANKTFYIDTNGHDFLKRVWLISFFLGCIMRFRSVLYFKASFNYFVTFNKIIICQYIYLINLLSIIPLLVRWYVLKSFELKIYSLECIIARLLDFTVITLSDVPHACIFLSDNEKVDFIVKILVFDLICFILDGLEKLELE